MSIDMRASARARQGLQDAGMKGVSCVQNKCLEGHEIEHARMQRDRDVRMPLDAMRESAVSAERSGDGASSIAIDTNVRESFHLRVEKAL
mmetsp:Transcript_5715/g.15266  ORF Transcript_5715/g.15266 Transcript_5715/m.15266 type:complete len:90 (-) Transcript_5715:72-341(-)